MNSLAFLFVEILNLSGNYSRRRLVAEQVPLIVAVVVVVAVGGFLSLPNYCDPIITCSPAKHSLNTHYSQSNHPSPFPQCPILPC